MRNSSHSPYQIGRATESNFKPGGLNHQNILSSGGKNNNQSSEKSFQGVNTFSKVSNSGTGQVTGIDMMKLQQLKAYIPPKLDYLAQIKSGSKAQRMNLISADASNPSTNPRLKNKPLIDRENSINRNDQNRESLQSRLIERIHNKK